MYVTQQLHTESSQLIPTAVMLHQIYAFPLNNDFCPSQAELQGSAPHGGSGSGGGQQCSNSGGRYECVGRGGMVEEASRSEGTALILANKMSCGGLVTET